MNKKHYRNFICDKCGKPLNQPYDLVIYNSDEIDITELSFRHGGGVGCDDKSFKSSRHVRDGFDDLLRKWSASPYNPTNKKPPEKDINLEEYCVGCGEHYSKAELVYYDKKYPAKNYCKDCAWTCDPEKDKRAPIK